MSQLDLNSNTRLCYKCKGLGQIHSSIQTQKSKNTPYFQKCKGCQGSGSISNDAILCEKCLGKGSIHDYVMAHSMSDCKYCKECFTCSSKGWIEVPQPKHITDIFTQTKQVPDILTETLRTGFQPQKTQPFSLPTLKELDGPSSPMKSFYDSKAQEPKSAVFGSKQAPEESLFAFLGARLIGPPAYNSKSTSQSDFSGKELISPSPVFKKAHERSASVTGREIMGIKKTPMVDHLDYFVDNYGGARAGRSIAPKPVVRDRISEKIF